VEFQDLLSSEIAFIDAGRSRPAHRSPPAQPRRRRSGPHRTSRSFLNRTKLRELFMKASFTRHIHSAGCAALLLLLLATDAAGPPR